MTIEGAPDGGDGIDRHIVRAIPDLNRPGEPSSFRSFEPFAIQPGGEAALEMEIRVSHRVCISRNSAVSWFEEPLIFTVLGIERRRSVETEVQINLRGTEPRER